MLRIEMHLAQNGKSIGLVALLRLRTEAMGWLKGGQLNLAAVEVEAVAQKAQDAARALGGLVEGGEPIPDTSQYWRPSTGHGFMAIENPAVRGTNRRMPARQSSPHSRHSFAGYSSLAAKTRLTGGEAEGDAGEAGPHQR